MTRSQIIIAIAVLASISMACRVSLNLPIEQIATGPAQEMEIFVPEPEEQSAQVTLAFGAGELRIAPGAEGALIVGNATYNVSDLKPTVGIDNNKVRIETGDLEINGIPNFGENLINEWDFKFSEKPIDLSINAGAYQGRYELGGLALQTLEIADGASDVRLKFSQPNKTEMDKFRYTTGASNVRLDGLGNANLSEMVFRSGAGDYTLDFSGDLKRKIDVSIESGISQVTIVVPAAVSAQVTFKGGLANVETSGSWTKSGDQYFLNGGNPMIIISVELGAGNLRLLTSE
jgi:hypothetical protein